MKIRLVLSSLAASAAVVLLFGTSASAHYAPLPGEGLQALTVRICGSAGSWQEQAARNGLTAQDRYWLYLGRKYDIQCAQPAASSAQPGSNAAPPAVAPAPVAATWSSPIPGTCRPSGGGGQFGAPRSGYLHQGIDLGGIEGLPIGTPVRAAHAGAVVVRGYNGNAGNQLQIREGGVLVKYNHLNGFAVGIGQYVTAGQVVGYMGATGNATGAHLHVEIWINGGLVDPTNVLPVRC